MVKKVYKNGVNTDKLHYVFEGLEPIFEKRISDGRVRSYVYALGNHLARVDGVIGDTNAKKYWYHSDQVGSVKAVTNQTGQVVWNADYLPFGTQYMKNKLDPDFEEDDLGFTGKGYDSDVGLYYFNARWYDADTGRFISEDPVADPNNPNLYSYCGNNPLSRVDPTGLAYDGTLGSIGITETTGGPKFNSNTSVHSEGPGDYGTGGSGPGTGGGWSENKNTKNEYDSHGFLKKRTIYNDNGTPDTEVTFNNKNGQVQSYTTYIYTGKDTRIKTTTYFTDDGRLVTTQDQRGYLNWLLTVTNEYSYEGYDSQGNQVFKMGYVPGKSISFWLSPKQLDAIIGVLESLGDSYSKVASYLGYSATGAGVLQALYNELSKKSGELFSKYAESIIITAVSLSLGEKASLISSTIGTLNKFFRNNGLSSKDNKMSINFTISLNSHSATINGQTIGFYDANSVMNAYIFSFCPGNNFPEGLPANDIIGL